MHEVRYSVLGAMGSMGITSQHHRPPPAPALLLHGAFWALRRQSQSHLHRTTTLQLHSESQKRLKSRGSVQTRQGAWFFLFLLEKLALPPGVQAGWQWPACPHHHTAVPLHRGCRTEKGLKNTSVVSRKEAVEFEVLSLFTGTSESSSKLTYRPHPYQQEPPCQGTPLHAMSAPQLSSSLLPPSLPLAFKTSVHMTSLMAYGHFLMPPTVDGKRSTSSELSLPGSDYQLGRALELGAAYECTPGSLVPSLGVWGGLAFSASCASPVPC